jgi:uncharacterized protein involved in exopolysaccharide biosynthesis
MLETRQKQTLRPMIPDSSDTIDISGFARYLYQRRKFIVLTSTVAVALAGIASFLTPFKYTATASILIEPPAGNDPRGAMAVSTVYLESLKTYERFAASDSLFRQALAQLDLRSEYSGVPIESLKRRMLKVEKPKDEKILEISATLPDKRKAQQLAEYIADQTIAMNRSFENHSIAAISRDATDLVQAAQATLQQTRLKKEKFLREQPVAPVEEELAIMADLKVRAERNLADAQVELAATLARIKSQPADQGSGSVTKDDVAAVQAQVRVLEEQSRTLGRRVAETSAALENRKQNREVLEKEMQAAQAQYEAAVNRRTELLSSESFRGERLEVIDPGVIPERPSSPNIALNLALALLASMSCSILYLAFRFAYARNEPIYR